MQPVGDLSGKVVPVHFKSKEKGSKLTLPFEGTRIAIKGHTFNNGGYGRITIVDDLGYTMHTNLIDFYSKVPDDGLRYVSPRLPQGAYTLIVECMGEHPHWSNKRDDYFGSREDWVTVEEVRIY